MKLFFRPNFLSTLSELFVNLSAGWFGAVLILPGVWSSHNLNVNISVLLNNVFYGIISFVGAMYLKDLKNAN